MQEDQGGKVRVRCHPGGMNHGVEVENNRVGYFHKASTENRDAKDQLLRAEEEVFTKACDPTIRGLDLILKKSLSQLLRRSVGRYKAEREQSSSSDQRQICSDQESNNNL